MARPWSLTPAPSGQEPTPRHKRRLATPSPNRSPAQTSDGTTPWHRPAGPQEGYYDDDQEHFDEEAATAAVHQYWSDRQPKGKGKGKHKKSKGKGKGKGKELSPDAKLSMRISGLLRHGNVAGRKRCAVGSLGAQGECDVPTVASLLQIEEATVERIGREGLHPSGDLRYEVLDFDKVLYIRANWKHSVDIVDANRRTNEDEGEQVQA